MSDSVGGIRDAIWNGSEGRLRAPWRLGLVGLLVLALGNAVSVGAVATARLGMRLGPSLRAAWVILVTAVALAAVIAGILAIAWLVDRRRLPDLGIGPSRRFAREIAVGVAVGAAASVGAVAIAVGLGLATVAGLFTSWTGTFALTSYHPALDAVFWLAVFLGVGVVEEVLLRGYVLVNVAEGLRGWTGDGPRATLAAVLASAGLFGALHAGTPGSSALGVATVVGFGLVLGATMALTGRLALAIGVHVAWNATLGLGFGLPVSGLETGVAAVAVELSGPTVLTGGEFGPEGGLVAVVGLAVAVIGLGWWLGRRVEDVEIDDGIAVPDLRGPSDRDPEGTHAGD